MRIVSLVPSITELLYHLELNDAVVGITKFCVRPQNWFTTKTRIGGTKQIHIEQIRALAPTLVIANKEENVKEQVEALSTFTKVLVTDVSNLAEALLMIHQIGLVTHTTTKAAALIQQIKTEFIQFQSTLHHLNPKTLSCAYLIWQEPFMTVGGDTFIHDMLQQAGLKNVFANQQRYPQITVADIQAMAPKFMLLSSEPFPFKQKHIAQLKANFPDTCICLVDGEMFSWYGSRLIEAPSYFTTIHEMIAAQL
jgi:ABC-type Fe3+-hydroxamate transport system substrate-binding protein